MGVSALKHFRVEDTREWAGLHKKECSRFALHREGKAVVSIPPMILASNEMLYFPSFSIDGAAPEKRVLKELATATWGSLLMCEERKQEIVPKLCIHWCL